MAAEVEQTAAAAPVRRHPALESLRHIFAMLLLPLSIAPVLLLGPSLLRAPVALFHEGWGEARRLETSLLPAHRRRPALGENAWALPAISLGPVYGRWLTFPQAGRARPGDPQLGPEGAIR
ncbi:MAG TPA: hypothetical protein VGI24_09200 [Solirubrobacteraceae bacterium]|jgi:hypothetical protein